MNRRNFLKNLLIGGAVAAVAPNAIVSAVGNPISAVFHDGYHGSTRIIPYWMQVRRLAEVRSQSYADALDEILAKKPPFYNLSHGKFSHETTMRPIP